MQRNIQNGFTLIELMIVVAIVGVLAGIAYPNYQDSLVKSRRADAKSALLELSTWMERLYTATGCYNPGTTDKICGDNNDAAPKLPFDIAPKSFYNPNVASSTIKTANYDLKVTATATSFTVTATPRSNVPDLKCGELSLNNTGAKIASYGSVADCW